MIHEHYAMVDLASCIAIGTCTIIFLQALFSHPLSFHCFASLSLQRLTIAREFGDRSAERRAYSNLGNAQIFLGQFDVASNHYK
jgi:hypothetical protein